METAPILAAHSKNPVGWFLTPNTFEELTIRTLLVPVAGAKARAVFDVLRLPCSILVLH